MRQGAVHMRMVETRGGAHAYSALHHEHHHRISVPAQHACLPHPPAVARPRVVAPAPAKQGPALRIYLQHERSYELVRVQQFEVEVNRPCAAAVANKTAVKHDSGYSRAR